MEISISKETERFADFLKQKDNENIIFSGAFGIGKSYFLNNFFNQHKDKYTGIYLTPITLLLITKIFLSISKWTY